MGVQLKNLIKHFTNNKTFQTNSNFFGFANRKLSHKLLKGEILFSTSGRWWFLTSNRLRQHQHRAKNHAPLSAS